MQYIIGFPPGQLKTFHCENVKKHTMEWQVKTYRLKMDYKGIVMELLHWFCQIETSIPFVIVLHSIVQLVGVVGTMH